MAELVDALVSNTNAARRAGSIPALGTNQWNIRSVNQSITERIFSFWGEWRTISFSVADDCSFSRCWGWGSVDKGNF